MRALPWILGLVLLAGCSLDGVNDFSAANDLHAPQNAGKPTTAVVTFDANTGTGTMADQSFTIGTPAKLVANGYKKDGYNFVGWNTKADGSGVNYPSEALFRIGFAPVTLYAQWTKLRLLLVNFDPNTQDYTGSMAPQSLVEDVPTSLTPNGFVRTGYAFLGWATTQNSPVQYADQASMTVGTANVILFAKWAPLSYTVRFDPNLGQGTMANQSFTYGVGANLASNLYSRTGYSFLGWNTAANGKGTAYADAAAYATPASDQTLYAQWSANHYTVTFDGNTGSTGTMAAQSFTYEVPQALTENGFAKANSIFLGWALTPNAAVATVADQALYTVGTANVTLYAVWTANSVLAFYPNGGSGFMSKVALSATVATTLPANGFTFTGYHLTGWNTQANGSGTAYANAGTYPAESTLNTTIGLYAQWTGNTYTVTFDGNGADLGSTAAQPFTFGTAAVLRANGYSRAGYTFSGWNTAANGSGTAVTDGVLYQTPAQDQTFYAQWTGISYTVSFNGNGHDGGAMPATQVFVYGTPSNVLANGYTKTGYTFKGWNAAANGLGTAIGNGVSYLTPMTNQTFFAQWEPGVFTVTFNGNGSSDTPMADQSVTYGTSPVLKTNTYTRTGYTFTGWNTAANGSGASYANGVPYATPAASQTLYAQWTGNPYTVTFNGNNSTGGTTASQNFVFGTAANLTANGFTRTGYTFSGWNTAANGTGTAVANAASYLVPAANTTLYAQWTGNTYTVTFNGNNSTGGTTASQNFVYGTAANLTTNGYTRTGYAFTGWNTVANGTGTAVANAASYLVPAANTTLYAQWAGNTYTVTFNGNNSTGGTTASQNFVYGTAANLTTNGYTRTGYTFAGWNTAANGTGTAVADGASYLISASNLTLYAQWTANSYAVTFDANGGSGTMGNQTLTFGQSAALTTSGFTRSTYAQMGWSSTPGGTVEYTDKQSFTMNVTGKTLYAVWVLQGSVWTSRAVTNNYNSDLAYGNGTYVAVSQWTHARTSTDGNTWTERTLPVAASWTSVAYGNGVFVAVSWGDAPSALANGLVSTDGITWTTMAMPAYRWNSVAFGGGKFVAVCSSGAGSGGGAANGQGKVAYSTDGTTWTEASLPAGSSASYFSILYGNGKFVAVSNYSYSVVSTDGINWTGGTMPSAQNWNGLGYGNGTYIATQDYSDNTSAAISTDGLTWTTLTLPVSAKWHRVGFVNGTFFMVSLNSASALLSTDNGTTWSTSTLPTTGPWQVAKGLNGRMFVLPTLGNSIYTSP